MSFARVPAAANPVPITPVTPGNLADTVGRLSDAERQWVQGLGFTGEAGTTALLPTSAGKLGRVLVGWKPEEPIWALGGLPDSLPLGSYALDAKPGADAATRMALGWALGSYAFQRYKARTRAPAALVWPAEADRGEAERLARGITLARDLINTPA